MQVSNYHARAFYEIEASTNNWSSRELGAVLRNVRPAATSMQ